jgi:hypothetical protein
MPPGLWRIGLALSLFLAIHGRAIAAPAQKDNPKPNAAGRYLILDTLRESTMQKELKEAAAAGFRVVTGAAGHDALLLEKDPAGTKHEYLFSHSLIHAADKGKLRGYRVLTNTFGTGYGSLGAVLEKLAEGEPQSEYHIVHTELASSFQKDMNAWAAKGFRLLALSGSSDIYYYGLMERTSGSPASGPPDRYLLLASKKTGAMEKRLAETAAPGYRVVAAAGTDMQILVALEKIGPGDANPEYELLSSAYSSDLGEWIGNAGRDGSRLLPSSLCALERRSRLLERFGYETAAIMEKNPGGQVHQYKLLANRVDSTLRRELAEAANAGWTVSRLVISFEEQIVLLEKVVQ